MLYNSADTFCINGLFITEKRRNKLFPHTFSLFLTINKSETSAENRSSAENRNYCITEDGALDWDFYKLAAAMARVCSELLWKGRVGGKVLEKWKKYIFILIRNAGFSKWRSMWLFTSFSAIAHLLNRIISLSFEATSKKCLTDKQFFHVFWK